MLNNKYIKLLICSAFFLGISGCDSINHFFEKIAKKEGLTYLDLPQRQVGDMVSKSAYKWEGETIDFEQCFPGLSKWIDQGMFENTVLNYSFSTTDSDTNQAELAVELLKIGFGISRDVDVTIAMKGVVRRAVPRLAFENAFETLDGANEDSCRKLLGNKKNKLISKDIAFNQITLTSNSTQALKNELKVEDISQLIKNPALNEFNIEVSQGSLNTKTITFDAENIYFGHDFASNEFQTALYEIIKDPEKFKAWKQNRLQERTIQQINLEITDYINRHNSIFQQIKNKPAINSNYESALTRYNLLFADIEQYYQNFSTYQNKLSPCVYNNMNNRISFYLNAKMVDQGAPNQNNVHGPWKMELDQLSRRQHLAQINADKIEADAYRNHKCDQHPKSSDKYRRCKEDQHNFEYRAGGGLFKHVQTGGPILQKVIDSAKNGCDAE